MSLSRFPFLYHSSTMSISIQEFSDYIEFAQNTERDRDRVWGKKERGGDRGGIKRGREREGGGGKIM